MANQKSKAVVPPVADDQIEVQYPSVEERVRRVRYRLTLALGATLVESSQMSCLAEGTLDEAVGEVLEDALEELYWVTKLPGSVLNMPAPDVEPAGGDQ